MTDYDSIYHRLFGHAGMVAALLREFVPEPWLDDFDLDAVTRENAKFHSDRGRRRHADTAWRFPRRDGSAAYVLIMLEFQSTIDRSMALRVLVYVGLLWQHLESEQRLPPDGRLPPVLPIVLYNGDTRWSAPVSLHQLVGLPTSSPLWKWQPNIRYYLIDEGGYDQADLAQRKGLIPLLFRLESASGPDQVMAVTDALVAWFAANPAPKRLRLLFVELLRSATEPVAPGLPVPGDLLEFRNMLAARMATWKDEMMRQGRQEGRLEGRQEGRLEGQAALLMRQLERRFGTLPPWARERIAGADRDALDKWGLNVLDGPSLDDVLA